MKKIILILMLLIFITGCAEAEIKKTIPEQTPVNIDKDTINKETEKEQVKTEAPKIAAWKAGGAAIPGKYADAVTLLILETENIDCITLLNRKFQILKDRYIRQFLQMV
ncbi:hypothetical protein J4482_02730 [Candidatus Woesearchaeota archaeon]|nr:hypothetical protein [Candidatus Woesearchaeota archaeon]